MSTTPPKPAPQWRQLVAALDEEERYRFFERVAILGATGDPTPQQAGYGIDDVRRYQEARREQRKGAA